MLYFDALQSGIKQFELELSPPSIRNTLRECTNKYTVIIYLLKNVKTIKIYACNS